MLHCTTRLCWPASSPSCCYTVDSSPSRTLISAGGASPSSPSAIRSLLPSHRLSVGRSSIRSGKRHVSLPLRLWPFTKYAIGMPMKQGTNLLQNGHSTLQTLPSTSSVRLDPSQADIRQPSTRQAHVLISKHAGDILILILPIPIIWNLSLEFRQKITICILFSLGSA